MLVRLGQDHFVAVDGREPFACGELGHEELTRYRQERIADTVAADQLAALELCDELPA